MPIYTKKGDRGQTGLFDGVRVAKDDPKIEAIGSVDELNAQIGVVISEVKSLKFKVQSVSNCLQKIQNDLFAIGGILAGSEIKIDLSERVVEMEREIDQMWKEMPQLSNFILLGGSLAGAQLHLARAVCRRAERILVREQESRKAGERGEILKYLNRLGDYLFALARFVNFLAGEKETVWKI